MAKDSKKAELLQVADLENAAPQERLSRSNVASNVNFSDREWLEANDPSEFHTKTNVSSKYDAEREPKVALGLMLLSSISGDKEINPLLILLGKWFEVKPARAEIKRMIDEEAASKGIDTTSYMQEVLADQIESLKDIQSAIDRLRYAKTYFKPREAKVKIEIKTVNVDGQLYKVPVNLLQELREIFPNVDDKDKIAEAIKNQCELYEVDSL